MTRIARVAVETSFEALWGGRTPGEDMTMGREKGEALYVKMLREELEHEWPGAEVEVKLGSDDHIWCDPAGTMTDDAYFLAQAKARDEVQQTAHEVWESWMGIV